MWVKKKNKTAASDEKNKKMRFNMKVMIFTVVAAYVFMMGYFAYTITTNSTKWLASAYNNRVAVAKKSITPGDILDRNGVVLATSKDGKRTYSGTLEARLANSHVVGDNSGAVASGAETLFSMQLYGLDYNNSISIITQIRANQDKKGDNVTLTIDSKLNTYLYDALGNYRGAVVLLNYKTGEVYALVSKPGFDPSNISQYLSDEDDDDGSSELVNRATLGRYTPGSVFKIITTSAALRYFDDFDTRTYNCTGSLVLGGVKISDYDGEKHGTVNILQAFTHSCNSAYALISKDLGSANLLETANRFKFNTSFDFSDFVMAKSNFSTSDQIGDLAWSGIGQYKDTVSPLHMAMIAGAIANEGVMMEPKLFLKSTDSATSSVDQSIKSDAYATIMTRQEAYKMQTLMYSVVTDGTGTAAAISGYKVGGKTGTAEVTSNDTKKAHAWFVSFIGDSKHPLAVAVILENAGTGGSKAAPIAKKAFTKAIELGY